MLCKRVAESSINNQDSFFSSALTHILHEELDFFFFFLFSYIASLKL